MSMKLLVWHSTRYVYSVPVALGEHVVRLLPQGAGVELLSQQIAVSPLPFSRSAYIDHEGNQVVKLSFSGVTSTLRIDSQVEALVHGPPALVNSGWSALPWCLPLASNRLGPVDSTVVDFALGLMNRSGREPVAFLQTLNLELFHRTSRGMRLHGNAQAAAFTLANRSGACRDLTVLFLDCCRAVGIEARFVSGYQAVPDAPDGSNHLHAWPEVRLPGLNWQGYDPMHGVVVSDGHLPLCAAPTQSGTMPVEGGYTFEGASLSSTLSYDLQVNARAL